MQPPAKKLCADCPFRRDSLRGYLGDHTVEEFIGRWRADLPMECHMTVDYESSVGYREQIERGEHVRLCAGALIMARNECRVSRDPDRPRLPADHSAVFSRWTEFVDYHDTEEHRRFHRVRSCEERS